LKWLVRCQQQLRDMAEDPDFAGRIIQVLDEQPDLRKEGYPDLAVDLP